MTAEICLILTVEDPALESTARSSHAASRKSPRHGQLARTAAARGARTSHKVQEAGQRGRMKSKLGAARGDLEPGRAARDGKHKRRSKVPHKLEQQHRLRDTLAANKVEQDLVPLEAAPHEVVMHDADLAETRANRHRSRLVDKPGKPPHTLARKHRLADVARAAHLDHSGDEAELNAMAHVKAEANAEAEAASRVKVIDKPGKVRRHEKEHELAHKLSSGQAKQALADIFAGLSQRAASTPSNEAGGGEGGRKKKKRQKPASQQSALDDVVGDVRGDRRRGRKIDPESGLPLYSEEELGLDKNLVGGGTPACPFDCNCCF